VSAARPRASGRRPIRVGWNLLWLVPGVVGGSEEYTTRLLAAVADAEPDDVELVLFTNNAFEAAYPDLVPGVPRVTLPLSGRSKPLRVLAETTWLGWQAKRLDVDLVHHLGGVLPDWHPTPTVLTIHDLQPLAMPAHFSSVKRMFSARMIPRSVAAATGIVTLTEFTRHDLTRRLGVEADRVAVIPPGLDLPDPTGDEVSGEAVRARLDLDDRPFFLYPAITYPHKNHFLLLRAMARLRHRDALLVLTGGAAQMEDQLTTTAAALGLAGRVRRTGRIPVADLDSLYREATALTFPSRYEGFGLPVLEAMSRGCPVIAADETALPEVVGDAGRLLPVDDPHRWSETMDRLLDNPSEREELARAGYLRARTYDWSASADGLLEEYRLVAAAVR
jgi:alpha-1,3-rhamnosyl/mannosyltransferase